MKTIRCSMCGGKMKRNGKTSAGRQRWRCGDCNASKTHKIDREAKHLKEFLRWLLSRDRQCEMPGGGRSFRRRVAKFWNLWPLPPVISEVHRVIYVDGIYLGRKCVVLIASSDEYVLGWYLAKSENSNAWKALMRRIAPPQVVVSDGGCGFEKARRAIWCETRVQRCTFHAFSQVRCYTTSRPKLPAGVELYLLAKDLLQIKEIEEAIAWLKRYNVWCFKWKEFLAEITITENNRHEFTHERLLKAKRSLDVLIKKGTLFTYLDPKLTVSGRLPSTNNRIEGAVNAQLRGMLRDHRGLSLTRRIKAIFWWCYQQTEDLLSAAELLRTMPTDDEVDSLFRNAALRQEWHRWVPGLGNAIVWEDFHLSGPRPPEWD